MDRPTVLVADDHQIVREGVRARLEHDGQLEVMGEADSGGAALEMIERTRPDVALVDYRLPGMTGVEVARAVRDRGLPTKVVIFSAHSGFHLLDKALEGGAYGFVSKDSPSDTLVRSLLTAFGGRRYVDPSLAAELVMQDTQRLSPRELEILRLMSHGMQNMAIAAKLCVSVETVKTHVSHILAKLDADSRTTAVATALRSALIE